MSGLQVILPLSVGAAFQLEQLFGGCPWKGPLWAILFPRDLCFQSKSCSDRNPGGALWGGGTISHPRLRRSANRAPLNLPPGLPGGVAQAVGREQCGGSRLSIEEEKVLASPFTAELP